MTTSTAQGSSLSIEVLFDDVDEALRMAGDKRPRTTPTRWPTILCALIATCAASAAFLESPAAQHPQVRPYAEAARGAAIDAWHDVRALRIAR